MQAQGDDYVAVFNAFCQRVKHPHAHACKVSGYQRLRAHHAYFGAAQCEQGVDIATRHARMQHVAHNGYAQIFKPAFVVANGQHIEQALRGVGVAAVARVDDVHMRGNVARNQVRSAAFAMAHHENIGSHGAKVGNGIEQRFAFGGG